MDKISKKQIRLISKIKSYKYRLITLIFVIWMFFLDSNSLLTCISLQDEINRLNEEKSFYELEIQKDIKSIDNLKNDTNELKRIAREKYFMKRSNEDVFIIEIDSSK